MSDSSRSLTIIINDRCPLRCRHCCFSRKYKHTAKLTKNELREVIRTAVSTEIFEKIIFTGGEPSLVPNLLSAGIQECQSGGVQCAVLTAPIWAKNLDSARHFLAKLPMFDTLILSCDRYHLELLDIIHYQNAISTARERGIKVYMISSYSVQEERLELLKEISHLLDQIQGIAFQSILPIGDAAAAKNIIPFTGTRIENSMDLYRLNRSCTIGSSVITPEKEVNACCWAAYIDGSPFRYNGQYNLKDAFDAMENDYSFSGFIDTGLLGHLSEEGAEIVTEAVKGMTFVNECHLCLYLMSEPNRGIWNAYIRK